MMSNASLESRRKDAIARGVGVMTDVYAERASNAEIWDVEGKRYIDFAAGIAVVNTGHRHPKVIAAVSEQLEQFTHTCHQVVPYENYVRLAERLNELVPGNFPKKTCFVTTGAEAVENAIKIARCHTNRPAVVAFGGGFHGRTYMGMSLTGKVKPYKKGFGAMMPDVYHLPFPVGLHGISVEDSEAAIQQLFRATLDPSRVAAVIVEPVQGEGGFYQAPAELMAFIRNLCDEHGICMIADEVQTGFARTGKVLAMEHYEAIGVYPDLTTMAKGLAGGLPLSAVTGRAEIMDSADPGGLGGTFAGNPLGIAAAHAVLDVIDEEKLCDRADVLGAKLKDRLESMRTETPQIADVRGPGLMVAVEFMTAPQDVDDGARTWNPTFAKNVKAEALRRGLILLTCGVHGNVIRFLPPVTIIDEHFDEALDILTASIKFTKAEEEKVGTVEGELNAPKAVTEDINVNSVPVAVPVGSVVQQGQ